ncbi:SCO1664 family protein [Kocuria soli]|uniref:SCO1664 family protein n=1 Tax=Kocuria soli TaxID=2485125 RepID=A0A3N3ZZC2_9MICC|nr:SCO1664 family protein [Kocuria soli]ROZ64340.1 SCO1664 family protein [Kocuria soli]
MTTHDDEALLATGEIELIGLIESSSNSALLAQVSTEGASSMAIYKPEEGERPLRDFPPRIYRRERAAYVLSDALGWDIVPPTVLRDDAPFGPGSVQKFVPHDPTQHYFTLYDSHPETHEQLLRVAVFDVVANNTDRKGGHVLLDPDGHVWGIDQGLCFSAPFKLRTVIWEFAGEEIPPELVKDLEPMLDDLPSELEDLLFPVEQLAIQMRITELLEAGRLPFDETGGYRIPWPPL